MGAIQQVLASYGASVPPLPAGATARWSTQNHAGSDGDLIATLEDLIGTNDATAAGSARPTLKTGVNGLNGYPVLRFDGVNNVYTLASSIPTTGGFTLIAIMKRGAGLMLTLGAGPLDFYPAVYRGPTTVSAGNDRIIDGGGYAAVTITDPGWAIISAACEHRPTTTGRQNGDALTFGATTAYGGNRDFSHIGHAINHASGDLADVILYAGTVLTDAQMQQAHAHLNATWGGVY